MDKIAVISDIHGNIPALEAVLEDIGQRGIGRIICLGDLVGKGPHSDTAVDMVRESCEAVVMGNWDDFITRPTEEEAIKWHQHRLGEQRLQYLKSLPFSVQFYMSGRLIRLYHASAKSIYHRVSSRAPIEEKLAMFENTDQTQSGDEKLPDVIGYGDIHMAYVQHVEGKILFNAGSVGNPLEIPQAAYAILEGKYGSRESSSFSVGIIRVPYDIERSIQQAREEHMPDLEPYIKELRTAKYRGLKE